LRLERRFEADNGRWPVACSRWLAEINMNIRRASFGFAMAGLFAASLSVAAPAGSSAGVAARSPAARTDPRLQRALSGYVTQHVAASGLEGSLRGYSLSPALIQLRRYVDPGQKEPKFVCVVALSLQNPQREIVAEIRGSAATAGASQLEALDAAAHSAVLRVPGALAKARERADSSRWAQR
jgi:hypothetical protein